MSKRCIPSIFPRIYASISHLKATAKERSGFP
jgi:hypothetical protein